MCVLFHKTLFKMFKQEPGQLRRPEADVQSIAMLIHHVANYLPEGTPEYELAISLVDLVQSMS